MTSPARRGSIRTQLILLNVLALTLLLGALGFVIRYTVSSTIISSVDRELDNRLRHPPNGGPPRRDDVNRPEGERRPEDGQAPEELPGPGGDMGGPPAVQPGEFAGPPQNQEPYRPRHFDLNGQALSQYPNNVAWDANGVKLAVTGQPVFATVVQDGVSLRVLSRTAPPRPPYREVIQVAYPLTDVNRAIGGLNRALLLLIPVALLGAGAGGAYLTDQVLRRVRRLAYSAGQISAEDLSERLPVVGDDEFADLAETFNGMLGRLESAFRQQERMIDQQRRFTADASHELKTPLTIIKGNTSLALASGDSNSPYTQSLKEIDQAADTMSHLVQDLLILARSDDGQLARNPIELLAREVLSRAMSRVPQKDGAPIRLTVTDEALSVYGNEQELIRLFANLMDNALRYTPREGHIDVTARCDGEMAVITVVDTGIGIAPQHLQHLGERFYRVNDSRARQDGGTGLGLSICKSIVDAHHGTIRFQSVPGKGTTVSVILPAG